MITPKIGLPGSIVNYSGGNRQERAGQIIGVQSATVVNARWLGGTDQNGIEFVDVGGTPPAAPAMYFQAIDSAS